MPLEFKFRSENETPPGQFRVTVEKTGFTIKHYAWDAFCDKYESHCVANGIELGPMWREELQDRLCRENLSTWSDFCLRTKKYPIKPKGNNFGAIMSFLRMAAGWAKSGAEGNPAFVEQGEAERRAAICATCPYNTQMVTFNCSTCATAFTSALMNLMGKDHRTKNHNKLGSCVLCGCALKAAVWVPLEPQQAAMSEQVKGLFREVDYCWKGQGL